jgi:excisionase family DNA binding protein
MNKPEPLYLPDLTIQRPLSTAELPPLLVSIRQASKLLDVSYDTVYQMIRRGDLQVWRRGKLVRIKYSSLVDLVESGDE